MSAVGSVGGVLLQLAVLLPAQGWRPVSSEDGVAVVRREPAPLMTLGAEAVIDAPPSLVQAVLLDYEAHPAWLSRLAESRVLERGPNWLDVYQRLALPIVSDRDVTLHVEWGETDGTRWLRFSNTNTRGPAPRKGLVRIVADEGSWTLRPLDDGRRTLAVYQVSVDFGGSLPAWMGRGKAAKELRGLLTSLRDRVAAETNRGR